MESSSVEIVASNLYRSSPMGMLRSPMEQLIAVGTAKVLDPKDTANLSGWLGCFLPTIGCLRAAERWCSGLEHC